jgi:NOL1/NOP2/sun family putative RNA methylase
MESPPQNALPTLFRQRLESILPPDRFDPCWQTFHRPPATVFRVNLLKTDAESLIPELHTAGLTPTPLPWNPDAFAIPDAQRRCLTETDACRQGRLYIQNPSSMVPPLVLDPAPDEWILDLTAAPGSKTLQLAAIMGNRGKISAVELVRSRFFRLRDNLALGGATNVQTYLKDGTRVWRNCPEQFDRVLLDAPCSSEGRFYTEDPKSFAYWSKKKIAEMSRKQKRLFYSAVQSLKPGGILVYSTCTFAPEENERIVQRALEQFPDALRIEPIDLPLIDFQEGLVEWDGKDLHPELKKAARILPDDLMEGFFICKLRKLDTTINRTRNPS